MKTAEIQRGVNGFMYMHSIGTRENGWIERYKNDFVMVHNPVFCFDYRCPYRVEQVVAVICDEGTASGTINLRPYELQRNSLLVILPDHIIEAHRVSDDFKGTYIFMSQPFLAGLNVGDAYKFYENVERNPFFQLEERMANSVHSYIHMCHTMMEISDQNPNTEESLQLLTRLFFLNLGWFLHREAMDKTTASRQSDVMEQFLTLVKVHYKQRRDVEYYAGLMNLSPKYMSTVVKSVSGKTALQWIEEYVVLEAKTQLGSTLNSVQQISYGLNFPTQSFFGRYFKRATGMSPLAYRKAVRLHTAE